MNRKFSSLSLGLSLGAVLILCSIGLPAHAQMGGALNPGTPIGGTPKLRPGSQADEPPPPALPGGSGIESETQSQVQIENEDPTKVLFTAINHGNYAEARAAISRGANLSARNALGETPVEMSVALNRNNITFMLLSMRGADSGGGAVAAAQAPLPVTTVGSPVHAHARPRLPSRGLQPVQQAPIAQTPIAQTPIAQTPGVPNPSAGFLGFNGKS